ncbi:ketosynthase chain-length factor [Amycolatopsis rubida]|uniref:Ketosynthase chain-length factor n=1 Tax=Amycolatopsis rubida TaxID=112413 RepID=A0ABX0CC14_9PSEU|nr:MULTISPECIES: beta-ketoacyl synthase N-terminal-like domain-containing protein [Amycolatopsis]MYW97972.1 ketosynthase chain-length factor [Amycolatopsis rubida]NEC62957.1 ketosynthase chain-length factor [Amycolatopsis rubida]OAP22625.1 Actinorhodin polyketide putative beta-ketoacyl synthase 2 [Amycolatopsis sp. M39]
MTARTRTNRPVVTGLGIVAPTGLDAGAYWAATTHGRSGIARITRFDPSAYTATVAGQTDLDAASRVPNRLLPQTDPMTRLALVAAEEALADAEVDPRALPAFSAGVFTAASAGGFDFGQRELEALWSKGGEYVSAYQSFAWFYPVNTGQISIRHQLRGPGGAVVADQAGGLDAVAKASRTVQNGTPLMVTGGVDGSLCPWAWICLIASGRVSREDRPELAYLPFDAAASGHVPGEGGAILIVEDPVAAADRGARAYGEISGHASTFDGKAGPGGDGLRRAILGALDQAEARPGEIDVVFADAAGVPELDAVESAVLAEIFGRRAVPVTAPKSMVGRLLAGAGPLDLAAALLSLRDGVIPPTVNVTQPAYAHAIDLVREAPRAADLASALVVARGHGGFNSAMVLHAVGGGPERTASDSPNGRDYR